MIEFNWLYFIRTVTVSRKKTFKNMQVYPLSLMRFIATHNP